MTHLIKEEGVYDTFDFEDGKDRDNNNIEPKRNNKEELQDESEFAVVI